MPKARITEESAKSLPGGDANIFYYDTALQGFGLRITKAGARAFIYQYKSPRTGLHRRITLGKIETTAAAHARAQAKDLRDKIRNGVDPMDAKQEYREQWNCQDLIDRYLDYVATKVKAGSGSQSHYDNEVSRIKNYIADGLGKRKVSDIDLALIQSLQKRVLEKGRGYQSNRVLATLSAMLKFAKQHKQVQTNVAEDAPRLFQEKERDEILTAKELVRFLDALNELEAEGSNPVHLDAIRLLVLTGKRKTEITALRWSEVDFENECLRLTRFKGSTTSTSKTVLVPLSSVAIEILRKREAEKICDLVFPSIGRKGKGRLVPVVGLRSFMAKGLEIAGIQIPGIVIHSLRHSYASAQVSQNTHRKVISSLLGHKSLASTERYMKAANSDQRAATELLSNTLNGGVELSTNWKR